jgi:hypothetical protein
LLNTTIADRYIYLNGAYATFVKRYMWCFNIILQNVSLVV